MGKPKKQHRTKKFNYNKNRKRLWSKIRKLPSISCDHIKKAWDAKKSVPENMKDMGLSSDPNKTLKIPTLKDRLSHMDVDGHGEVKKIRKRKKKKVKTPVVKALEKDASVPEQLRLRYSEPEVKYCIYMMEKYGDDYKAMARDPRNYDQETPKQIRRKINSFKNIPEQYQAYLSSKEGEKAAMDTT